MLVFGTRPEAIKLAPVVTALRSRAIPTLIVATGQHPHLAPAMLQQAGLQADIDLGLHRPGITPPDLVGALVAHLPTLFRQHAPRLTLVQGDTTSAFGAALAATYAQLPLAHVEAGLRAGHPTDPFPEEMHRRLIAPLACLHFAPTASAAAALRAEGIPAGRIHVTGNSGIDAVLATSAMLAGQAALAADLRARFPLLATPGPPWLLATVHRRENQGERLSSILAAFAALARGGGARLIVPVHPTPAVQQRTTALLGHVPGILLCAPQDHAALVWLIGQTALVLTDSGGLQEEAPALGRRVLILREATERPEGVDMGAAQLVGTDTHAIIRAVHAALALPPLDPCFPYGDGRASHRIAAVIERWLHRAQPTRAPRPVINGRKSGKLVAMGAASSTMTG
ncbi:non-hydrolyzing UDP-N-acetylglucosamine 2-epimerase [Sandaracinobacteroides saxicola]|nr:UDP-N-acetylglucosamine 2-epimerase (non-hydrolyzing) [Sandaracinobacteroides saxicola]